MVAAVAVFNTPFLIVPNSTKLLSLKSSKGFWSKEQLILRRSAPGAAKLLNPFELSVRVSSSSEFIISSMTLNPTLHDGRSLYCDNIIVSFSTLTNWPLTKYTPSAIEKEVPVEVASTEIHDANDSPEGIKLSLSGPEVISALDDNNSPSINVSKLLFWTPDEIYWTYIVKLSLSESSAFKILSIIAETPDDWPTTFLPINWSRYELTGIPKWVSFISTAK